MQSWLALVTCLTTLATVGRAEFPQLRLNPISVGELTAPVALVNAGDGSNRMFAADQRGRISVIENGQVLATPLLDLGPKLVPQRPNFDERGLLGLTFHPDFEAVGTQGYGKFYTFYSAPQTGGTPENPINCQNIVSEFTMDPTTNVADLGSERILFSYNKPQFNHNGGQLLFGPDRMLYITTGDGGGADDNDAGHTGGNSTKPMGGLGNAQDLTKVLGKVLRIDPQGANGPGGQYGIPADNPFVGNGGGVREEIYAYGLRNPWSASFDDGPGGTNRMFLADVGQGLIEEINLIEAGGNYGWRIMEGSLPFDPTVSPSPSAPLIGPISEYTHPGAVNGLPEIGLAVTGGQVYRGDDFPELQGKYIFGDWSNDFAPGNGTLMGLEETSPGNFAFSILDVEGGNPLVGQYITAFGRDEDGEIYLVTRRQLAPINDPTTGEPTGAIYRISVVPEPASLTLGVCGLAGFAILVIRGRKRALAS